MWKVDTTQTTETWDDLVLPEPQVITLKLIASQFRLASQQQEQAKTLPAVQAGQGMAILFYGPTGAGKGLAARILANVLETHLWRFDLNLLVSKFSGESEHNLHQLLNQADELGVVLLMDNAEALFGKRAETKDSAKDSQNRFPTLDMDYLLSRLNEFKGIAILASQQKNTLEPTLIPKMRFTVEFPFPDREAREQIWQRVLANPMKKLDFKWLARFELSGGSIYTVARDVSSRTAREGRPVNETEFILANKTVHAHPKPHK